MSLAARSISDTERANADADALAQSGILPKHSRYQSSYQPNDVFWGLGIEHEFYLETGQYDTIAVDDILIYNKPERYSVRYNTIHNKELYEKALLDIGEQLPTLTIPILYNAYSWQKTDINDQHKTTYSTVPRPNPSFSGNTIHELLCQSSDWLREKYDKLYTFDGDTFEIMTQEFYKTTVENCISEYVSTRRRFIEEIHYNSGGALMEARIMGRNFPFARYKTNPQNIAMFNNGTVHINITLPTKLNGEGKIKGWLRFVEQHRSLARAIQWIEPLWVAVYGAADPLAASKQWGSNFSAGSQRCAVSRYIGIGTYDTDEMPRGKILQTDVSFSPTGNTIYKWYDELYRRCEGYKRLDKIGMDMNFNKHPNHGLELRFFDQIPVLAIREIFIFLVHLADFTLSRTRGWFPNVKKSPEWCDLTVDVLQWGKSAIVPTSTIQIYERLFGCKLEGPMSPMDLYHELGQHLMRYKGCCYNNMLPAKPIVQPFAPVAEKPSKCRCM